MPAFAGMTTAHEWKIVYVVRTILAERLASRPANSRESKHEHNVTIAESFITY
jgi:hypothetical protein